MRCCDFGHDPGERLQRLYERDRLVNDFDIVKRNSVFESAAVQTAQRRKSQQEFLARGRESLNRAKKTGKYYAAAAALDAMQTRLDERMSRLGREERAKTTRS